MSTKSSVRPVDECSDAELLQAVRGHHDRAALSQLIQRHHRLVKGVCEQLLGHTHDSDDAYQATFMLLTRKASTIRSSAAISSWLYTAAFRIASRIRQQRARRSSLDFDPIDMGGRDPWEAVAQRDQRAALHSAVVQLPESLRRAVILRYLLGQTNQQVAVALSISEAALEGRLKRAKSRLRGQLAIRGATLAALFTALPLTSATSDASERLIDATVELYDLRTASDTGQINSDADSIQTLITEEVTAMLTRQLAKILAFTGLAAALVGISFMTRQHGAAVAGEGIALATGEADPAGTTAGPVSLAPVESVVETEPDFYMRGMSSSERAIRRALRLETKIDFNDTPLREAMDYLGQVHNMQIAIDQQKLDDLGLADDAPVTARFSGISLKSALALMLRPLSLTYIIRDEVLTITSLEAAEAHTTLQLYPLDPDGPISLEELSEAIQGGIAPDSWSDVGGNGFLMTYQSGLIVSQSQSVHQQIVDLLEQFNRQAARNAR